MSERCLIENISDTARLVAAYRAIESERPDASFEIPSQKVSPGKRVFRLLLGGLLLELPWGRNRWMGNCVLLKREDPF